MVVKRFANVGTRSKQIIAAVASVAVVSAIILVCFVIYPLLKFIDPVMVIEMIVGGIVLIAVLIAILLVIMFFYQYFYSKLFEDTEKAGYSAKIHDSWTRNEGAQPPCGRVNVQFTDDSILWNVETCALDWSLDLENRIKSFLPKQKKNISSSRHMKVGDVIMTEN